MERSQETYRYQDEFLDALNDPTLDLEGAEDTPADRFMRELSQSVHDVLTSGNNAA